MKRFAALLAVVVFAAGANASDFVSFPGGVTTNIIGSGSDECAATLYINHDGSFENGCAWQYGGIVPPMYGAFGEGFDLGAGTVECAAMWLTQVGNFFGQPLDVYVWDGGVAAAPGAVLSMIAGQVPSNVPFWPTLGQNDFEVGQAVTGEFTVGYWADFSAAPCAWFIGIDADGFGGFPWTNIAPGIGYPTGWQNPSLVWGTVQSLGFGAYFETGASPVEEATWGEIKALFD